MTELVLVPYTLALCVLVLHGLYAGRVLTRTSRSAAVHPEPPATLPRVTIQLPVYNEPAVVERLLHNITSLDYPADLIEVQILDDSTDVTSAIIADLLQQHEFSMRVSHIRRSSRAGYKAGALAHGLSTSTGELIAIFDADFTPDADFLHRTVGAFQDEGVAFVQARWTHRNATATILTRAQAIVLDAHFKADQRYRAQMALMLPFNGTAGIWRRAAISDAGGWQSDTLTEDVDLAYRAQMKGWKAVYCDHVVVPADLPSTLPALSTQQVRWTKGTAQTALKLLPTILQSSLPWTCRIEAVMHLSSGLVFPSVIVIAVLQLPLLGLVELPQWLWIPSIVPVITALVHRRVQGAWKPLGRGLPVALLGTMGLAVRNSRAVVEAMLGRPSEFERTPKGSTDPGGSAARRTDATVEILLALYLTVCVGYSIGAGWYLASMFQLGLAVAFGTMGVTHILHICRSSHHIPTSP